MARRWVIDASGDLIPLGNYSLGDGAGNDPVVVRAVTLVATAGLYVGEIKSTLMENMGIGREPDPFTWLAISGGSGGRSAINFGASSPMPAPLDGDLWYDTALRFRYGTVTRSLAFERRQRKENTDADFTLTWLTSEEIIRHTGTLTAPRSVTITTAGAPPGATFRISRVGGGAFPLNVSGASGGVLKAVATGQWGDFTYGATDGAWYLAASGTLIP